MSDFINSGWAWYVAGLTVVSLAFCVFILVVASKRKVMAADNTTGHVWDEDLREMNNPLPRWWMWLFVITIVFAAIYLALYPGLGTNPGALKWSSTGQWEAEQQKAYATMAPVYAKFTAMPAEALAKDPQAMGIGERLFVNNCAQCHGSDARGSKGFPNLTDGDWLGGTGHEYIKKTVVAGRVGMMPADGCGGGRRRRREERRQLCAQPVGQPAQQCGRPAGQGQVRRVCRLPWCRRQGQPGPGRPQPHRQGLAARLGRGGDCAHRQQRQAERDAGLREALSPEQIHVLAAYVWNLSQSTAVAAAK
jgi:cytochrome c oxidase cbb3-type subunit 3